MSNMNEERVLSVHHWTDRLFSFTTTRSPSLRFSNGHFTMIGLRINDKPLLRAYSIASANYEDHLEFLSIKVEGGPLTSHLKNIQVGDSVIGLELPLSVVLTISETTPAMKAASASARTKPATLETGLVVQVPEYIQEGEKVKVNTSERKFMSRA